jgi:hypothetical protein
MDPSEILRRGRTSTFEGRHEEALRDFLWFHKHALEHDRAYYGVRLSFALGYWKELADVYEPAAVALDATRREAAESLLRGEGSRSLFHDVASIDRELGRTEKTYELFVALKAAHPDRVKNFADLAMSAIVTAEDFLLAMEFLPHPEHYLLVESDRVNGDLEREGVPRETAVRRREAYVHNYCEDVRMLLQVLLGVGEREWARAALVWAIGLIRQRKARAMVASNLLASENL